MSFRKYNYSQFHYCKVYYINPSKLQNDSLLTKYSKDYSQFCSLFLLKLIFKTFNKIG